MTKKLKILLPLLLLGITCLLIEPIRDSIQQAFLLLSTTDLDSIKEYILSFGIWAPAASFCLMLFQALIAPLPAFLITFSNAALFGWFYGAILSWSSAMLGAALCFFIARSLGGDFVAKITSRFALQEVDRFFIEHGKYAILIARLLPFISFDIVSYAAGLTSMNFSSFFWATGLGQLPATLIYSYAGEMLTGSAQAFVTALLTLFALSVLTYLLKRIWNQKRDETG